MFAKIQPTPEPCEDAVLGGIQHPASRRVGINDGHSSARELLRICREDESQQK